MYLTLTGKYRLISLLNNAYKLFTNILATGNTLKLMKVWTYKMNNLCSAAQKIHNNPQLQIAPHQV